MEELDVLKFSPSARRRLREVLSVREDIASVFGIFGYVESTVMHGLVHAMKYRGGQSLCVRMGEVIGEALHDAEPAPRLDCLVPVPIHPARMRERRYNQSVLLARGIGARTGLPVVENALRRRRKTRPQAFLDSEHRLENIRNAFYNTGKLLPGARVGLVDDVVTTGATVSACAHALKEGGVGRVTVLCLAVAQSEPLLPIAGRALLDSTSVIV